MVHLRRNQLVDFTSKNWKLYQSQILSKDAYTFLKISFFFKCYSHFFAIANQLPGFSISKLANVGDFFNVNIFFKCKLNINVSVNNHSLYLCSMLLETLFVSPVLQCRFWIHLTDWVSKWDEYRNYWVLINAFWIRLRFVKYRFVRYRFVRYWFRFVSRPWLDTDIPSKHFVCLQDVFKTCLQDVFKTSSA